MEESSPRRGTGAVVLVLVVMGLASLQGVSSLVSDNANTQRGEGQRGPEAAPQAPSPSPDDGPGLVPSPEPSGEPPGTVDVAGLRFKRLVHPYPRGCLRVAPRPTLGKIAAFQGGSVSIVEPGSDRVVKIGARMPIAWSASGRYLATGRGDFYRPSGRGEGSVLNKGSRLWEWSPIADCAVAVDGSGLWVDGPQLDPRRILDVAGVEQFSFSADGRRLGFVLRESEGRSARSIWIADLGRGSARRIHRYGAQTPVVRLLGWNAAGTRLFYGSAPGESVAADGVALRYTAARGPGRGRAGATLLPDAAYLTNCGRRDLVVAGAGRETNSNKRLAYLSPSGPTFITPTSAAVMAPSCSPDGGYIVAVASGDGADVSERRLALLRSDGSFERFLAPEGSGDEYPIWGPPGSGLAFVRMRPSGRMADVWFIPEGGSASPTPLVVAVPPEIYGHFDWSEVLTWSAAP